LEWSSKKSMLTDAIMDTLANEGNDFTVAKWGIDFSLQNPDKEKSIRVFNGPESEWFDEHTRTKLFRESFGVSNQSNRMGYRLSGPAFILSKKRELISTAVCSGTIQVTHEGSLVLLMADAQTTGGYPRLAMVAAVDLPACAQLRPGDSIQFREISMDKAEELYLEKEKRFRQIQASVAVKFLT
jgi:antagonist of KipI